MKLKNCISQKRLPTLDVIKFFPSLERENDIEVPKDISILIFEKFLGVFFFLKMSAIALEAKNCSWLYTIFPIRPSLFQGLGSLFIKAERQCLTVGRIPLSEDLRSVFNHTLKELYEIKEQAEKYSDADCKKVVSLCQVAMLETCLTFNNKVKENGKLADNFILHCDYKHNR